MAAKLIIILGRGKSGTRIPSHLLQASGVFMGLIVNCAGDKTPHDKMNAAARFAGLHVSYLGDYTWNFDKVNAMPIPPAFMDTMALYLCDIQHRLDSNRTPVGWKMPETILTLPYLVRLFPDAHYIHWVRDPRAVIRKQHKTDDINDMNVTAPKPDDKQERRAISWLYHYQITQQTPKPKHWLQVRFEDFVSNQEHEIKRLEHFLGIPLGRVITRADVTKRYQGIPYPFLESAMEELEYC